MTKILCSGSDLTEIMLRKLRRLSKQARHGTSQEAAVATSSSKQFSYIVANKGQVDYVQGAVNYLPNVRRYMFIDLIFLVRGSSLYGRDAYGLCDLCLF